jgi:hypothetical protein
MKTDTAYLVASAILNIDTLSVVTISLALMAFGSYLDFLWPHAYFYLSIAALSTLAIVLFTAFILIPIAMASDDIDDD